jgi:hypothetical protein
MPEPIRRVIAPPSDFPSPKAGTCFAQMDGHGILDHLVEHQAGHADPINLLRHLYRVPTGAAVADPA